MDVSIQMFVDVRWVGFLQPQLKKYQLVVATDVVLV
jgi:hypothetical protein